MNTSFYVHHFSEYTFLCTSVTFPLTVLRARRARSENNFTVFSETLARLLSHLGSSHWPAFRTSSYCEYDFLCTSVTFPNTKFLCTSVTFPLTVLRARRTRSENNNFTVSSETLARLFSHLGQVTDHPFAQVHITFISKNVFRQNRHNIKNSSKMPVFRTSLKTWQRHPAPSPSSLTLDRSAATISVNSVTRGRIQCKIRVSSNLSDLVG